jgi:ABC-2 type transport system ATP-binding protein
VKARYPDGRRGVWQEIRSLAAERELTILLTTHYLEEADEFADRLAIMDDGRVVASGTPDELKRSLNGDSFRVQLAADVAGRGRPTGSFRGGRHR